jgi:hypothetical protein
MLCVLHTAFHGVEVVEKVLGSRVAIVIVWIHGSAEEGTHAGCGRRNLEATEVDVPDLSAAHAPLLALSLH